MIRSLSLNNHFLISLATITLQLLIISQVVVRSQIFTCPVEDVTLGLPTANFADPSTASTFTFSVDDVQAQLTGMRFCINNPGLIMRGWEPQWSTSQGPVSQVFVNMNDNEDLCAPAPGNFSPITGEIEFFSVYVDSNDLEGIRFTNFAGDDFIYKANYPLFQPPVKQKGRIIGFKVVQGSSGLTQNQPLQVAIIYNDCNCPVSNFLANAGPVDEVLEAVNGPTFNKVVPYQQDKIGELYGQDCGTYKVSLTPTLPFVSLSTSGSNLSPNGNQPYTDTITYATPLQADRGIYTVTMSVEQDFGAGDGYTQPFDGTLDSISYQFTITVNPCQESTLTGLPATINSAYELGTNGFELTYDFVQPAGCQYALQVTIPNLPSFITHDPVAKKLVVNQTFDTSLIGLLNFQIVGEIQVPSGPVGSATTSVTGIIDVNMQVDPCQVTQFQAATSIAPQEYTLGDPQTSFGAILFQQQICTYPETYTLENTSLTSTILSINLVDLDIDIANSNDENLIGEYLNIVIKGTISVPTTFEKTTFNEVTAEILFNFKVQPCQVNSYQLVTGIPQQNIAIGFTSFTTPSYILAQQPNCQYAATDLIISGSPPAFVSFDSIDRNFDLTTENDQNLANLYTISVQSSITFFDDFTKTTSTTLQVQVDTLINLLSCAVSSFTSPTNVGFTSYALGEPGFQFGNWVFVQSNGCSYPETYTLSGEPVGLLELDIPNKQFNIIQASGQALNFVNEYTITVEASIFAPTSLSDPNNFVTQTASFSFTFRVNPCQILSFTGDPFPATLSYTLGDAGFSTPQYSFTQTNACNYAESLTISGLPPSSVVTSNLANNDFTFIQTINRSIIGNYSVTISATIDVPTDFTLANSNQFTQIVSFTIQIIDPCPQTILQTFDTTAITMEVNVKGAADLQNLDPFAPQDSLSQSFAPNDGVTYCGPRQYSIASNGAPIPQFLSLDQSINRLTLLSIDQNHVTASPYTITIEASLSEHSSVAPVSSTFTVVINSCVLTSISAQATPTIAYQLGTPTLQFSVTDFLQQPDCGKVLSYDIQQKDPNTLVRTPLPAFLTSFGNLNFEIQTSDPNNLGFLTISVITNAPEIPTDVEAEILVSIASTECEQEVITAQGSIQDQVYYITEATLQVTPLWTSNAPLTSCPFAESFQIVENGVARSLTAAEQAVLSFDGTTLSIQTNDFSLDLQIWTVRFSRTASLSLVNPAAVIQEFSIEFKDRCWDSTIIPPLFQNQSETFTLYNPQSFLFFPADNTSEGAACGTFSYELEYVGPSSTPKDLTFYSIASNSPTTFQVSGTTSLVSWIGQNQIRVVAKQRNADLSRGSNGFYLPVRSGPLNLIILDPCFVSQIESDSSLPDSTTLVVPLGQTLLSTTYLGPSDATSNLYGAGLDICGPLKYQFVNFQQIPINPTFISVQGTETTSLDTFKFQVNSESEGQSVSALVYLQISLEDYPQVPARIYEITVLYRECVTNNFSGTPILDQQLQVGDLSSEIGFFFDITPCFYTQRYSISLKSSSQNLKFLPNFISIDQNIPLITFGETKAEDTGTYKFVVRSTINSAGSLFSEIEFNLEITNPSGYNVTLAPIFNPQLTNLRLKVETEFLYTPAINVIENGWTYRLRVSLNRAGKFTDYDPLSGQFTFRDDLMNEIDIGTHIIFMEGIFSRGTEEKRIRRSFTVTVFSDALPPPDDPDNNGEDDDSYDEASVIFYPEWPYSYAEDFRVQPYEPERPIPYVVSMSSTGLLTIGWDRQMDPPVEYEVIPEAKVAVYDYKDLSSEDIQERVEFEWFKNEGDLMATRLALIDALEVRLKQNAFDDEFQTQKGKLSWDIVGYNSKIVQLRLFFSQPEQLSEDSQNLDQVEVTFWGTQYFKSIQGREVRRGSSVSVEVLRQVSVEQAQSIDNFEIVRGLVIATFILMFAFAAIGSILPTWIFINSMSLVAHSTLLNTLMPGNVHFIFNRYLNLVRLNWPYLNNLLRESYDYVEYDLDDGLYNIFLKQSDFSHLFGQNLVIIISTGILIGIVWLTVAIKDFIQQRRFKMRAIFRMRHEPMISNVFVRFIYEVFLDVFLCILINVSLWDTSKFSPSFQWFISMATFGGLLIFMGFIFSLFYFKGPYISNFYDKGTLVSSLWQARPFDLSYNAQKRAVLLKDSTFVQRNQMRNRLARSESRIQPLTPIQHIRSANATLTTQNGTPLTDRPLLDKDLNNFEHALPQTTSRSNLQNSIENQETEVFNDNMSNNVSQKEEQLEVKDENVFTERGPLSNKEYKVEPVQSQAEKEFDSQVSTIDKEKESQRESLRRMTTDQLIVDACTPSKEEEIENDLGQQPSSSSPNTKSGVKFDHNLVKQQSSGALLQEIFPHGTPSLLKSHDTLTNSIDKKKAADYKNTKFANERLSVDQIMGAGLASQLLANSSPETTNQELPSKLSPDLKQGDLIQLKVVPQETNELFKEVFPQNSNKPDIVFNEAHLDQHQQQQRVNQDSARELHPPPQVVGSESRINEEGGSTVAAIHAQTPAFANSMFETSRRQSQYTKQKPIEEEDSDFFQYENDPQNVNNEQQLLEGGEPILQIPPPVDQDGVQNSSRSMLSTPRLPQPENQEISELSEQASMQSKSKYVVDQKQQEIIQASAKELVASEDLVEVPPRYKTLYLGLKLNHPRNVAVVHPIMFLFRRIFYALSIVMLASEPLLSSFVFMLGTLGMLIYALSEFQWRDSSVNQQHIVDEIFTYILSVFLLLFTNVVDANVRINLGYALIGLFIVYVVYNIVMMLRFLVWRIKLLLKRISFVKIRKSNKFEAKYVLQKLKNAIIDLNWEEYDNLSEESNMHDEEKGKHKKKKIKWQTRITGTFTGGYQGKFFAVEDSTDSLKQYPQTKKKKDIVFSVPRRTSHEKFRQKSKLLLSSIKERESEMNHSGVVDQSVISSKGKVQRQDSIDNKYDDRDILILTPKRKDVNNSVKYPSSRPLSGIVKSSTHKGKPTMIQGLFENKDMSEGNSLKDVLEISGSFDTSVESSTPTSAALALNDAKNWFQPDQLKRREQFMHNRTRSGQLLKASPNDNINVEPLKTSPSGQDTKDKKSDEGIVEVKKLVEVAVEKLDSGEVKSNKSEVQAPISQNVTQAEQQNVTADLQNEDFSITKKDRENMLLRMEQNQVSEQRKAGFQRKILPGTKRASAIASSLFPQSKAESNISMSSLPGNDKDSKKVSMIPSSQISQFLDDLMPSNNYTSQQKSSKSTVRQQLRDRQLTRLSEKSEQNKADEALDTLEKMYMQPEDKIRVLSQEFTNDKPLQETPLKDKNLKKQLKSNLAADNSQKQKDEQQATRRVSFEDDNVQKLLLVSANRSTENKDEKEGNGQILGQIQAQNQDSTTNANNLVFNINVSHDQDQILEDYPHQIDMSKPSNRASNQPLSDQRQSKVTNKRHSADQERPESRVSIGEDGIHYNIMPHHEISDSRRRESPKGSNRADSFTRRNNSSRQLFAVQPFQTHKVSQLLQNLHDEENKMDIFNSSMKESSTNSRQKVHQNNGDQQQLPTKSVRIVSQRPQGIGSHAFNKGQTLDNKSTNLAPVSYTGRITAEMAGKNMMIPPETTYSDFGLKLLQIKNNQQQAKNKFNVNDDSSSLQESQTNLGTDFGSLPSLHGSITRFGYNDQRNSTMGPLSPRDQLNQQSQPNMMIQNRRESLKKSPNRDNGINSAMAGPQEVSPRLKIPLNNRGRNQQNLADDALFNQFVKVFTPKQLDDPQLTQLISPRQSLPNANSRTEIINRSSHSSHHNSFSIKSPRLSRGMSNAGLSVISDTTPNKKFK